MKASTLKTKAKYSKHVTKFLKIVEGGEGGNTSSLVSRPQN